MFATALYEDEWKGMSDEGKEYLNPDENLIRVALESLDGQRRTLVMLRNDGDANLAVGGGESGKYVVYGTFDNRSFQILTRNVDSDSMITVNAGGQAGEYPERWVVGIDDAMKAALSFALNGILDPSLIWQTRSLAGPSCRRLAGVTRLRFRVGGARFCDESRRTSGAHHLPAGGGISAGGIKRNRPEAHAAASGKLRCLGACLRRRGISAVPASSSVHAFLPARAALRIEELPLRQGRRPGRLHLKQPNV